MTFDLIPPVTEAIDLRERDTWGKTLTWWRDSDYLHHPYVLARASDFYPRQLRIALKSVPRLVVENTIGAKPALPEAVFENWWRPQREANDMVLGTASVIAIPKDEETVFIPPGDLLRSAIAHHALFPDHPVHYRGISGARSIAFLGYLSQKVKSSVTYDSEAFITPTSYFLPFLKRVRVLSGSEMAFLPDDCTVCSSHDPEELSPRSHKGQLLILHNLSQLLRFTRLVAALRFDEEYALVRVPKETREMIQAFEVYEKRGYEAVKDVDLMRTVPGQRSLAPSETPAPPCAVCGDAEATRDYPYGGRILKVCQKDYDFYAEVAKVL